MFYEHAKTFNFSLQTHIIVGFFSFSNLQLEEKEKALSAAELEMNALTRLQRRKISMITNSGMIVQEGVRFRGRPGENRGEAFGGEPEV